MVLGKKCGCTKNKGLKQKQSENAVYIKLRKKYVFWQKHASTQEFICPAYASLHIGLHVTAYSLLACLF